MVDVEFKICWGSMCFFIIRFSKDDLLVLVFFNNRNSFYNLVDGFIIIYDVRIFIVRVKF